jgi:hypothetical protein
MKHLEDSKTTYWEHFKFAIYASILLIFAGITSIIHAIVPSWFQGTAAWVVIKLYRQRLETHPNPLYQKWVNDVSNNKKPY